MRYSSKATSCRKPDKPRPDWPLFPHANGQWAKKVRGRLFYFGGWDDPDKALALWVHQKDDLLAGRVPRPTPEEYAGLVIKDLCNEFLTDRTRRMETGDLVARTLRDYRDTCDRLIKHLSATRLVSDLRPEDFTHLRVTLAKRRGATALGNEIQRIRTIFKFAYDSDLIDRPIKFGPTFTKPSRKALRHARNQKGPRMFEAHDLLQLINAAQQPLKAMIYLGANCGYGNSDCATLPTKAIDFARGWINYPRPKTGIQRRCPLWPETIAALAEVRDTRKTPKMPEHESLFFVTKYGNAWVNPKDPSVVSKEFRKLLDELDLHREGLGFYALRHGFETVAGESRDQVAVDHIMGHEAPTMASVYRERISDDRLVAVTNHVRTWLFGNEQNR